MRPPVERYTSPLRPGWRWLARRSNGRRLHAGVDLMASVGTPVLAPEHGRVVVAVATRTPHEVELGIGSARPWDGYGPGVVLLHGASGWYHLLGHCSRERLPAVGDVYEEGEELASIGRLTGGPHTHWETRAVLRPPAGRAVIEVVADPFSWLRGEPHVWTHGVDPCPEDPGNDRRTPGPCRPQSRRAPLVVRPPTPFDPAA